jgi:WD40 repeat protein
VRIKRILVYPVFLLFAACSTAPVDQPIGSTPPVASPTVRAEPTRTPEIVPSQTPTPTHTEIPIAPATPSSSGAGDLAAAVAAGGSHTCAITTLGGVKCWGKNDHGQLGNGTFVNSSLALDVAGLTGGVTAITAGWAHTCALTAAGGVKCWGYNKNGELGNGTTAESAVPMDVTGLTSGATAIAAGDDHTCAVTADAVECWGLNTYSQLGDGTTTDSTMPVSVAGISGGVAGIAAGWGHTCILTVRGGVMCWGNNEDGQLGDGTNKESRAKPADVSSLTGGVSALSAYGGHTCAVTLAGRVKCWGYNKYGQLGDGTSINRNLPTDVKGLLRDGSTVAVGSNHTCALIGGFVKCWGWNFDGQLGNGTATTSTTPVTVTEDITAITAGGMHSCGVTAGGGIRCWGNNSAGQLGDGTTDNRNSPVYAAGWAEWIMEFEALAGHTNYVRSLAFSPDGKLLASSSDDGTLILWNAASGKELITLQTHADRATRLAFSPDGKTLASAGNDGTVEFWSVPDGRELRSFSGMFRAAFSPDWKTIAAFWQDSAKKYHARMFDLASGSGLSDLDIDYSQFAFSPDGRILASGVSRHNIFLWEVATGKASGILTGEGAWYSGPLFFSPDGKWIASTSDAYSGNWTFGLWSLEQEKEILVFHGHERSVNAVGFSADGKMLISGSSDGTLKFWNAATGGLLRTMKRTSGKKTDYGYPLDGINCVAISADGTLLASGSSDGLVRLWRIDPNAVPL